MQENPIIRQVVDIIRRDILTNASFISKIMENIQLTAKNIDPNLILSIMAEMNRYEPLLPPKRTNKPTEIRLKDMPKPVAIASGKMETQIVSDLLSGNNVYIYGRAGTGKTYLAEAIAESVMNQKSYTLNCSQWTSPIDIRGGQTITGYQQGLLIKAWAEGAILILDELPKLDPNTAGLLNDALAKTAAHPQFDEDGNYIEGTIPYITDGRGERIYKGQDQPDVKKKFRFGVIGTGNTDMKSVKNTYSGNQKQDYSLVDRFAGSYYALDYSTEKEKLLTYAQVYKVSSIIRRILDEGDNVESISLRTMLNFNRTYEQEQLYRIQTLIGVSPFADEIYNSMDEIVPPKTFNDSINSFLDMLEKNTAEKIRNDRDFENAMREIPLSEFITEFELKYGVSPETGNPVSKK